MNNNRMLLCGGLAILLIYTCRIPVSRNFEKANELLTQIEAFSYSIADWEEVEHVCLHWSVLSNPQSIDALGNYAIFHQCITKDYDKAENLYRRALFLDLTHPKLNENYKRFIDERLPGGLYSSKGPGATALRRSIKVNSVGPRSPWFLMHDPEARNSFSEYFYWNSKTKEMKWTLT